MNAPAHQPQHVIVIMLENRSFDHLLGYLDHPSPAFDGLTSGPHSNPLNPADPAGERVPAEKRSAIHLRVDPDHAHAAVLQQLGLSADPDGTPRNDGFVWNYEQKATGRSAGALKGVRARRGALIVLALLAAGGLGLLFVLWPLGLGLLVLAAVLGLVRARFMGSADNHPGDGRRIMWAWDPATIPALSTLATSFTLCQHWYSSVPGETWPNRQFAHAATSHGTVDITEALYHDPTIFEVIEAAASWRIYYDGPAQVTCYEALWDTPQRLANWYEIQHLFDHIAGDDLPAYAFVEPNHGYLGRSYSQHPGNNCRTNADFTRADGFVAGVYEALRAHPEVFEKTVLVVTWDEHGGTYDHSPPGTTVPPDTLTALFDFRHLGVRVPTLVISPWAPAALSDTVFEHASIPRTLRDLFAPGRPLNPRGEHANSLIPLLSSPQPRRGASLPDLARHAWQPKAAWNPLDPLIGWLQQWFGLHSAEHLHTGLARLSVHLDQRVAGPASRPRTTEPTPLPPLPPRPRRRSSKAMRTFMASTHRARSGGGRSRAGGGRSRAGGGRAGGGRSRAGGR